VRSFCAWPRLVGALALLALTAACNDGSETSETETTITRSRVAIEGRNDGHDWSLALTPQEEGFCLEMSMEPGITEPIVVGRALHVVVPSGDSCILQELDADWRAVSFEPVFAPFILQGQGHSRAAIGGVITEEADELTLELSTGELLEASLREQGLFVEFPPADVAALRYRIGDEEWRCEVEQDTEPTIATNSLKTCQAIE
jgi:hypothetical protein